MNYQKGQIVFYRDPANDIYKSEILYYYSEVKKYLVKFYIPLNEDWMQIIVEADEGSIQLSF